MPFPPSQALHAGFSKYMVGKSVLVQMNNDTCELCRGTSEDPQDGLSLEYSKFASGWCFCWWILQRNYQTNHRLATRGEATTHPLQGLLGKSKNALGMIDLDDRSKFCCEYVWAFSEI